MNHRPKSILGYRMSSRLAWATWWDPVSKQKGKRDCILIILTFSMRQEESSSSQRVGLVNQRFPGWSLTSTRTHVHTHTQQPALINQHTYLHTQAGRGESAHWEEYQWLAWESPGFTSPYQRGEGGLGVVAGTFNSSARGRSRRNSARLRPVWPIQ